LQWLPAGILAVAVLVLLVLVVVFSHGVYWAKKSDSSGSRAVAQEQVLAAAKKCFVQINSYDYRHLDGLTEQDLACTTGTFTGDLRKALQTQILKYAPKIHARQTAQINYTGIASVSPAGDQVVVLIYGQLNQSNDNTAKKQPRVDIVDAVVTVSRVHGSWLISKVDSDIPST
jgi:Mce-associated membrane protein